MKHTACFVAIACSVSVHGEVVVYEGLILPETAGWQRQGTFDAERWLEDGWFHQFAELGEWTEPVGETDVYRKSLADFVGVDDFFIEWIVETDIPASVLDVSGVPTALAASGNSVASYHFTITDARVRVIRSNFLPIIFVAVEPRVPHKYRLELIGEQSCAWYIDDQLVDSGHPEGAYPAGSSFLVWGCRHDLFDNNCRWQYVRYGTIPEDGSTDYDSDGNLSTFDFYFLHECLSAGAPGDDPGPGCRFADMDDDTDVDLHDFALFQTAFTGGE